MNQDFEPQYSAEEQFQKQEQQRQTSEFDLPQDSPELHTTEMTSLILGILSLVLASCCLINVILAIVSICFAVKTKAQTASGRMSSMGLAGLICSVISVVITVLVVLLVVLITVLVVISGVEFYGDFIHLAPM